MNSPKVSVVEVGRDGSRISSVADSLISRELGNELWEGGLINMNGESTESFWVVSFCRKDCVQ